MHLAFINNLYPPYVVGGNEMLCDEVVTALRERGHRVSVLCGRGRDLPAHPDLLGALEIDLDRRGETFLGGRLPSAWEAFKLHAFSPRSYRTTQRWLAEWKPDVVIVWNLYMASMAPLIAARRSHVPCVVHVCDKWLYFGLHDLAPLLNPVVRWKRGALAAARHTLQPLLRLLARPQRMVAISEFMKAFYVRAGFDASSIEVIHLGVPTDQFAFVPRPESSPKDPFRLLYVGSLWEGKGPQTAVRALALLTREGVPAHLDICGDGAGYFVEYLRDVIAGEGVSEHVSLHGRVDRASVRRLCQSHDVLVFPSQWDEPFAAVPVEAMSCGMAVVATAAGGTSEAIVEGETGLLVPPADAEAMARALRRLYADADLRCQLGRNAAASVRARFDFRGYVDRLEDYYRRVAGTPLTAASR
jgi:glycogen synthase